MKWIFNVFSWLLKPKGFVLSVGLGTIILVTLFALKGGKSGANPEQTSQGILPVLPANQVMARAGKAPAGVPNWEPFDYIYNQSAPASYKVVSGQQQREASQAETDESRRFANRQNYFNPFSRPIPLPGPRGGGGASAQAQGNAAANAAVNRYRAQMGGTLGAQGVQVR